MMGHREELIEDYIKAVHLPPSLHGRARKNLQDMPEEELNKKITSARIRESQAIAWIQKRKGLACSS